jgi:hypothetical protein
MYIRPSWIQVKFCCLPPFCWLSFFLASRRTHKLPRVLLHCKIRLTIFPSSAWMSLTKLSLDGKNLSRAGRLWFVTSRLGLGKWQTFFREYSRCIIVFKSKEAAAAKNQFENLIPYPTIFTELDPGALPFTSLSCCLTCTATVWRHGERLLSMQVHCLKFSKINFKLARLTPYKTLYFSFLNIKCANWKKPHVMP